MEKNVIEVRGLVKVYGETRAVDGISFDVREGSVFAFLGPNGAGKTTTVEIIETIRRPTAGEVGLLGMDINKDRKKILERIGVLPQEFSSFDRMTVRETVHYFRQLFGAGSDVDALLKLVNLEEEKDKLYMNLSGGLKQRVGIAVALVNDPELVFLDEPTTGLDPRSRREVWNVIEGLKKRGKTIFLTTHYMEEAEVLADHIAIISKGKIIAQGSPSELIDAFGKAIHVTIRGAGAEIGPIAKDMGLALPKNGNGKTVVDVRTNDQVLVLLDRLKAAKVSYSGIDVRKANLEEVFLSLTGEKLTAGGDER
ncbi:MAG: ABC transporter ATP-binding protein [Euryarchaeota archaeon]|nr:ABC transporter ATP-binding protein [Euryarchaeota archaeon]